MAYIVASNITSPLGMTTGENYLAVKAGRSMLRRYDGQAPAQPLHGEAPAQLPHGQAPAQPLQLPEPFCASLFTDEQRHALAVDGLTRFESLVVHSVTEALQGTAIDITAKNVIFILSTTKANVELLSESASVPPAPGSAAVLSAPGEAALRIARHFGFANTPVVVCNACISGVAAIILAQRLLDGGQYDYAVVCGADVQCPFTVAGFQSLKAVATDPCRPFDMERTGLNLGEAAATMVMTGVVEEGVVEAGVVEVGVIRNDAFHISSPSKNGEGAWLALRDCLTLATGHICDCPPESLAFINAHGTATMFNDQMESVAIERAGLSSVPVNGLKGYYGHTLGAAGVLETVISLAALRDDTILATRGFEERGVSGKIRVTTGNVPIARHTSRPSFVKMISGFGGGNAAIIVTTPITPTTPISPIIPTIPTPPIIPISPIPPTPPTHRVTLTPTTVTLDGRPLSGSPRLADLYKRFVDDYPKFYKMDGLSRLGFIASELLLQAETSPAPDSRAIVLFNTSSSIAADLKFQATIAPGDFFPSPSVFVYTLPNIVAGEIAMRNGYHGETSFYILPHRDEELMNAIILSTFRDPSVKSLLTGWLDYYDEDRYEADLFLAVPYAAPSAQPCSEKPAVPYAAPSAQPNQEKAHGE